MFEKRSDLKKFLIVAETGTVLGAADRIAMTQPALSRAIARLEAAFGGKLFERLPTGVRLTEFGATAADQARPHPARDRDRRRQGQVGAVGPFQRPAGHRRPDMDAGGHARGRRQIS